MNKKVKKEIGWLLKEKYKGKLTRAAEIDIEKLKRGEPIDYLIGFVEFLGCKIDLSLRPFIPESETEYWAEKAIENMKAGKDRNIRCLDIFAGSGCIGIAILKACPEVCRRVDFAEIDKKFLKQIKINAELNRINKKRYKIIQSNIFQNIRGEYDFIFANPPYIARRRLNKVQKSVLNFEPKKALLGGKDGLLYIKKFLEEAKKHLRKNGKIYMEFDSFQKKEIEKILKKFNYNNCKFYRDQYNKWRYLVAELK